MTAEDIEFLNTIQEYADKVMPDIDPQKVQISEQLQKLRPPLWFQSITAAMLISP